MKGQVKIVDPSAKGTFLQYGITPERQKEIVKDLVAMCDEENAKPIEDKGHLIENICNKYEGNECACLLFIVDSTGDEIVVDPVYRLPEAVAADHDGK